MPRSTSPRAAATAESERLAMLATEYHLDRRVRSAHRGAEIATAGWQGWPKTGGPETAPLASDAGAEAELATQAEPAAESGAGSSPLAC